MDDDAAVDDDDDDDDVVVVVVVSSGVFVGNCCYFNMSCFTWPVIFVETLLLEFCLKSQ